MFVKDRAIQFPIQHATGIAHRKGQRHAPHIAEPVEADRHGKGTGLRVADAAIGQPLCHPNQFIAVGGLAVPQLRQNAAGVHPCPFM